MLYRNLKKPSTDTLFFASSTFLSHLFSLISAHISKSKNSLRVRGIHYLTFNFLSSHT